MTRPMISVIIPCHNAGRFLGETIESVLAQRYPNVEIIVVDDGSTDNSAATAARYPQVRCLRQRNAGVAAARNTGLRHSTGAYIVFLDHDDRLLPGALESNLQCLIVHRDCAFVFGDVQCIDANGAILPHRSSSPHEGKELYLSLLHGSYTWTPGASMYRRDVLNALPGFDRRVDPACHYDLNLRIARTYPVCHNNTVLLEYRLHSTGLSNDSALLLRAEITVLRWQKRWARSDRRYMKALRRGMRFYEDYAGTPLMTRMVANIRKRTNWRETWAGMLVLVQYAPLLPARWAYRKLRLA